MASLLSQKVFQIASPSQFNEIALGIFRTQYQYNNEFRKFAGSFLNDVDHVDKIEDIPFMPVELFKTLKIQTGSGEYEMIFKSSGTAGMSSSHFVNDISVYDISLKTGFKKFYGDPSGFCFLALLPSYLERKNSSLVYMVSKLMDEGKHPQNGFFLYDHKSLSGRLESLKEKATPVILIGVSFALLDFAEKYTIDFPSLIVMETGGMKGRGEELIREDLHFRLSRAFGVKEIHSEYGMTELLSQAYSSGNGRFRTPPWMKVLIRDPYDPLTFLPVASTGLISIVDLANINSCSFVSTQDIGRIHSDGTFEVLGRMDHSDIRGCNLLYV